MDTEQPFDRIRSLARLESEEFDLGVIGGGINGAAIARDAAMRGLRVALVERGDFAGGTSSRSSKLIHGGFRYLPQGQLRLVHSALRERELLRSRTAPHLVHPVRFLFPLYRGGTEIVPGEPGGVRCGGAAVRVPAAPSKRAEAGPGAGNETRHG